MPRFNWATEGIENHHRFNIEGISIRISSFKPLTLQDTGKYIYDPNVPAEVFVHISGIEWDHVSISNESDYKIAGFGWLAKLPPKEEDSG